MNERSSTKKKREHDFAINAFRVVEEATRETDTPEEAPEFPPEPTAEERHHAAVKLGRLGGKKGGPARSAKLSPEERREIAKKAAKARWQR
ncbi:MAG: hypothetical protein ACYC46_16160 [Acidobacteriaceae bacterium]